MTNGAADPALPPPDTSLPEDCFDKSASTDESYEILIRLDQQTPLEVAAILAHELVHAAVGTDAGHGPRFGSVARALGLEGGRSSPRWGPSLMRA
jgi:hypothetical protein